MAALLFIISSILNLVVWAFLLRVLLPLCRADARNPLSQGIIKFTNPLVLPLRRILPTFGRLDGGSLVALLLVQLASTFIVALLSGFGWSPSLLFVAAQSLLVTLLQFYFFALLVYALLSWVAPGTYSPAGAMLSSLCTPVLRPIQRVIPPIAGLDLSVVFAMIAIQALLILLRA